MRQGGALAAFHDLAPAEESFRDAALSGLTRRAKSLPCRFLYDERGSALFEEICELPEYYLTRTEMRILADDAGEIAATVGPHAQLIEFGSGASRKVRLLLDALVSPAAYVAIDISREQLRRAAEEVATDFPDVPVVAICADYTEPLRLPPLPERSEGRRLGFFPGSTIGNFAPGDAVDFLAGCRRIIGRGGGLLIGVDLVKDPAILHAAYNDAAGVTAAFNKNLLARANRELDAGFALDGFAHYAPYNPQCQRIEMYLVSLKRQSVALPGGTVEFFAGEAVHTEDSHKYSIESFREMAARAGFSPRAVWTDEQRLFSIHWLES